MSDAEGHGFTLTPLSTIRARLAEHDWPWARDNADAIERNWEKRRAVRPSLFDGTVLLSHAHTVEDGVCDIAFFETRFSRFIAFRDAGSPDEGVANAFAAIVPHTADGAVLLGQMGPHTANAGQIYFPCGTPDRDDLRGDGTIDLAGSASREFHEETGLALPETVEQAPWLLARGDGQLAFLRPVRFAERADAMRARVEAYRAREDVPELARLVLARGRTDIDAQLMPGFVRAYLESVFPALAGSAIAEPCPGRAEQPDRLGLSAGRAGGAGTVEIGAEALADGSVEVAGRDVALDDRTCLGDGRPAGALSRGPRRHGRGEEGEKG